MSTPNTRVCVMCEKPLADHRAHNAKYCGQECRNRAIRERIPVRLAERRRAFEKKLAEVRARQNAEREAQR